MKINSKIFLKNEQLQITWKEVSGHLEARRWETINPDSYVLQITLQNYNIPNTTSSRHPSINPIGSPGILVDPKL